MSETPRREPQPCCHDGQLTTEAIQVGEVHTASGAGKDIWACPEHIHLYPATPDRRAS